ncbi:MAG: caspase family protein, partial [Paracoccaceae bacterium]|nr:caspase family protein [Paracoccaceae bacterium]
MRQLAATFWLVMSAVPAHAQQTFGLVIGIDEYTYVSDLHGAVNDAEDIADALTALGGEVTLLLNANATRDAILGAWE